MNATELIKPKCKLCKSTPVQRKSKHLFLDLEKLQPELTAWVESQKVKGEWSANAINITDAWLKLGLKPRCITRDLKWCGNTTRNTHASTMRGVAGQN